MSAPRNARARVRAELTREILAAAHEELVAEGAAGLSLRAVARRLQMVPSALYRYFPNRDALLTALIIGAYEEVGAAAERAAELAGAGRAGAGRAGAGRAGAGRAGAGRAGAGPRERWLAVAAAVRGWGQEHPHEWALVYGSPVPGYRAPQDTVAAAVRVTTVICGIFAEAFGPDQAGAACLPPAGPDLATVLEPVQAALLPGRTPEVVAGALLAWTQLFGMVSLELFGHYVGASTDFDAVFDYTMAAVSAVTGLPGA